MKTDIIKRAKRKERRGNKKGGILMAISFGCHHHLMAGDP